MAFRDELLLQFYLSELYITAEILRHPFSRSMLYDFVIVYEKNKLDGEFVEICKEPFSRLLLQSKYINLEFV